MWFETIHRAAHQSPDKVAFREDWSGRAITFRQLYARARDYACGLVALGIKPGDTVVFMGATSIELVVVMLGHYLVGAMHAPINTRYGLDEVAHILSDSGAVLAAVGPEFHDIVKQAGPKVPTLVVEPDFEANLSKAEFTHAPQDEDIALLIYTSGTTGKSKGVELSFRAVGSNIHGLTTLWRWSAQDELVLALPLFHVHGLCIGVHGTLIHGCTTRLHHKFDPGEVVEAIGAGGTVFMGVPTMYAMLLEHLDQNPTAGEVLAKAGLFTSGSAALSVQHFEEFRRRTGHAILERYGMTETLLTLSNPYEGERRPGTVGFPVTGSQVQIIDDDGRACEAGDVGQIVVRGDSLMTGYRGQPEQTAASYSNGWFLTGDIGEQDADGYIRIVGRASTDIIKSGGFKISAREIEEVLAQHSTIREIAVFGGPDETWGEQIVAAVVAATTSEAVLLKELQALGRAKLADFKQVRSVLLVDALPRNAMGKVQKHVLKQMWCDQRAALQRASGAEL